MKALYPSKIGWHQAENLRNTGEEKPRLFIHTPCHKIKEEAGSTSGTKEEIDNSSSATASLRTQTVQLLISHDGKYDIATILASSFSGESGG